ncbi:hypothetical protein RRG08_028177 [Elysia crispata]|uniref:Uncharacterized protein n=1 Tax=Elysia crispata TaxID=231223 RepID=A0AAE0Z5N7_9GAST|nr:hypothetical protein RRG08_028177 [Elysia crispata]
MSGTMAALGRPVQKRDTGSASRSRQSSANSERGKRTPIRHLQGRRSKKKGGDKHEPQSNSDEDQNEAEDSDPEEKLCTHLQTCLAECSRQRLRALQMSLRHYGNVDNRVSYKDMQTSLQESQIKLSQRAVQMMTDLFQDAQGIDYTRLYSCMDRAHLRTGRDSVKARHKRNDLETKQAMTIDQVDNDFLRRLEELVVREEICFEIDKLRTEFSKWDHHRLGKIDKEGATLICCDKTPLYGALMKNLLNRCDEDKDNKVSWPLLLNFLEKAQANAYGNHPELPELVEKKKESKSSRIVTPEPFDELSSSTRSKVVSKLMKKATSRRSPVSPQPPKEEQGKELAKPETKPQGESDSTKIIANAVDKGKTPIDIEAPAPSQNGKDKNETQSKEHSKEKLSNHDENVNHMTKVSSNQITAAVPRGYQSPAVTSDPPKERLQLEWIYGYRGHGQASGSRPQLLASGEMAYFIACTVVLYDWEGHRQRHYREHTASIRCLAVHYGGVTIASAQDALSDKQDIQAHIRVWRCDTLATLHVLGQGMFQKTVIAMSFMPGQDILAACDNSQDKQITIWNTSDGQMVASTLIYTEVVNQMSFNPRWPEVLVTCGKEHLAWWKIYIQTEMVRPLMKPNYEGFLKARHINCVRHNQRGDLITGDSNGTVYVWGDGENRITNFVKHGHEGPVLDVLQVKGYLLTAGRDGAVRCWTFNKNMDFCGLFQLPDSEGGARSLLVTPSTHDTEAELVIGTTMNSIMGVSVNQTGPLLDGTKTEGVPITQGHAGDLRALARVRGSFLGADIVTASSEGLICKLNSGRKEPVWKLWLKGNSFSCVDSCEGGDILALGTRDGHVMILEIDRSSVAVTELYHRKLTASGVNTVSFSPDERMLAVGTSDGCIHILHLNEKEVEEERKKQDPEEEWAYYGILKGHTGQMQSLDWSSAIHGDTYIIRSSTLTPEQKFWDAKRCNEIPGESLNDFPWSSSTCMLDHKTAGLWSSRQASEGHLTCVDVNPEGTIVAMATTSGSLSIFQYPCCADKAFSHTYRSHHSPQNLCFTVDGRSLLTVGGADTCIMQWRIV